VDYGGISRTITGRKEKREALEKVKNEFLECITTRTSFVICRIKKKYTMSREPNIYTSRTD